MGKHLDLVGTRFGRLMVNNKIGKDSSHRFVWNCVCDCGNSVEVPTQRLRSGQTRSCGCVRRLEDRKSVIEKRFFVVFRVTAKRKNHIVDIPFTDFVNLIQSNCFYCKEPPSNVFVYEQTGEKYLWNGLDRIDSSKHYTIDNVVPCCKRCNVAKNNMTTDEFREWIKRIYTNFVTN